jgi:DeoR/GlpR family transcriptional regulator of sugar metabolism
MVLHASIESKDLALPANRQRIILDRLSANGQVSASLLAKEFSTSEDTIRRDLRDLASRGFCQRVYGGAVLVSPASTSIQVRATEGSDRKQALGKMLATLLRKGQFIFIDAGTTNLAFARHIPDGLDITVATHDPVIASCLVGRPGIELLTVGGKVSPKIGAALGGGPMREITKMSPDLFVLGACSIDAESGVGAFDFDDAQMKTALIEIAGSTVLAVQNEKLGTVATHRIAAIDVIADIVVEADAPPSLTAAFLSKGLRVHHAKEAAVGRIAQRKPA